MDTFKKHCNLYTLVAAASFASLIISEVLVGQLNTLFFNIIFSVLVVSLGGIVFLPQKEYAIFSPSPTDVAYVAYVAENQ